MNTLESIRIAKEDLFDFDYNYQAELTNKLDEVKSDFDQDIINEIVLWKVNRYSSISSETLRLINEIKNTDTVLDKDLTRKILKSLLESKGVRLAMASTILRFKNPKIYQIIDQRVYRFITGQEFKYSITDIDGQIDLYLNYLEILKERCEKYQIDYEMSDRIIYQMDKKYNKDLKIKY
ncbi:hypothetical protein M3O96_09065 [Aquiflexum sp. TKW24L]|uniref:hypothetical protein n=1 Tax=Aquiflexum sp. TKW24L TaxID=2942212 RepID=UPI0020BE5111|nr:hypothetical protein [Aquiflexum sp. TKW24L]MCL6259236.1 hypothetical protein [Aquiflexum sp. TKW24L]